MLQQSLGLVTTSRAQLWTLTSHLGEVLKAAFEFAIAEKTGFVNYLAIRCGNGSTKTRPNLESTSFGTSTGTFHRQVTEVICRRKQKGGNVFSPKQTRDADAPQVYRLTEPRVPRPVPGLEHLLPS